MVERSQDYWNKRAEQKKRFLINLETTPENLAAKQYQRLFGLYQEQLSAFFGRYGVADGNKVVVTPESAAKLITPNQVNNFHKKLNKVEIASQDQQLKALTAQLKRRNRISRKEVLDYNFNLATSNTKVLEQAGLTDFLTSDMQEAYYLTVFQVQNGLQESFKFGKLSQRRIDQALVYPWSGANFSDRIWDNKDLLVKNVRELTTRGFVEGKTNRQMAKELAKRTNTEYKKAERLIRTESAYITEQGTADAYASIGLEEYEYLAVLDERTSDLDIAIDGNVYKLKDKTVGVNFPPLHPNCRGTTAPVFDGAKIEPSTKEWKPQSYDKWKKENKIDF